jgi:hypothetical protein
MSQETRPEPGRRWEVCYAGTGGRSPAPASSTGPARCRCGCSARISFSTGTSAAVTASSIGTAGIAALADETGLAEPALVLAPPAAATREDDGLLTADEVGTLRLNADWIVLSACNTAGPFGRGLSGLVRAFLFAGAKAL